MNAAANANSIEDLRRLAKRRLPRAVFDFFDGGAEDEWTLRENRSAFSRHALRPRVLVDVTTVDCKTSIVGAPSALPIAVAPTGAVGFGWPGGDVAIAKAAAAAGIPYALSTSATTSIETIAREAPGRLWFQAYVLRDREFLESLIARAEAAGYEGLMITVDLPVGGKRERDFRNDFSIPFRFTPKNVVDFALHPRWVARVLRSGMPRLENLAGLAPGRGSAAVSAIASSVGKNYDAGFDWSRLAAMRERWKRKLIVKGIAHPDDAARLAELGVDAIVVSNHGGRQLDGGAATLDLLPDIVAAVGGRVPVLVDGGVRRGADIVKARALGAQAVLVGRATLFGAVAAGEPGAQRAIAILHDEVSRTLRLCGLTRFDAIGADLLAR
ncbi:alpha-hydroxy acid oxidase [Piscinibacter sakaiensis]|uniref:alpha-hydroxy acid oxidase n=1 Tax=Piscinibacter sakaiensis TaxID=1547922 RepID=UPI003AAD7D1E